MPQLAEIADLNREYLQERGFKTVESRNGMEVLAGTLGPYPVEVLLNEHYVQVRVSGDVGLANAQYDSGVAVCVGLSLIPDDVLNVYWPDLTNRLIKAAEVLGVQTTN